MKHKIIKTTERKTLVNYNCEEERTKVWNWDVLACDANDQGKHVCQLE
jgi:hypothetical protein